MKAPRESDVRRASDLRRRVAIAIAFAAAVLALAAVTRAATPVAKGGGAAAPASRKATAAKAHGSAAAKLAAHRPRPGFSLYQQMLTQHVWTTSEPGQPLETRFNYELFYDDRGRAERCFHIREQFLEISPLKMDAKSRTAWAINFYNYLVVEQITDHLLIPNKFRQRYLSVQDIKPDGEDFFQRTVVKVDSVDYSLDAFERHFLFADFDREPGHTPPRSLDPRIHFALVCGAIGCPPLQPRAFRPDSLDLQLNRAVKETLASPSHFRYMPGILAVQMSAIFYRYAADFPGGTLKWATPYLPKEIRAGVVTLPAGVRQMQILWDWKLNQVIGWRFHYQMDKPTPGVAAPADTT